MAERKKQKNIDRKEKTRRIWMSRKWKDNKYNEKEMC